MARDFLAVQIANVSVERENSKARYTLTYIDFLLNRWRRVCVLNRGTRCPGIDPDVIQIDDD